MAAKIIDGNTIAAHLLNKVKEEVALDVAQGYQPPTLAVILVGEHPASEIYVARKQQACQTVEITVTLHRYPSTVTAEHLREQIELLNADPKVHGILVQLPLPTKEGMSDLLRYIDPKKDVDGFHPHNLGKLLLNQPGLRPCTPVGVMMLLHAIAIDLSGKHAVVIGASPIVGKPMALELLHVGATVTICHSKTVNLAQHVQSADILVVAAGQPHLVPGAWIKPGATIIDVGIHRTANNAIIGDVNFEEAKEVAAWITPVPGGVGPMTVAMLMQNTLIASRAYQGKMPT